MSLIDKVKYGKSSFGGNPFDKFNISNIDQSKNANREDSNANATASLIGSGIQAAGSLASGIVGGVQTKRARESALAGGLADIADARARRQKQQQFQQRQLQLQEAERNWAWRVQDIGDEMAKEMETLNRMRGITDRMRNSSLQTEANKDQMTAFTNQGRQ